MEAASYSVAACRHLLSIQRIFQNTQAEMHAAELN